MDAGCLPGGVGGAGMSVLHLLWIVPASVLAGIFMAALLRAGDSGESGGGTADDKTEEDR